MKQMRAMNVVRGRMGREIESSSRKLRCVVIRCNVVLFQMFFESVFVCDICDVFRKLIPQSTYCLLVWYLTLWEGSKEVEDTELPVEYCSLHFNQQTCGLGLQKGFNFLTISNLAQFFVKMQNIHQNVCNQLQRYLHNMQKTRKHHL